MLTLNPVDVIAEIVPLVVFSASVALDDM